MQLEWDEAKAASNLRKHGVRFEDASRFEFDTALIEFDVDLAYGEERMKACGVLGSKLFVMIYVERRTAIRIISLRKATNQEKRDYEKFITGRG